MLTESRQASLETFFIRSDYRPRTTPAYFSDDPEQRVGLVWQPDVYATAARVAEECGAQRLVDIGCGDAQKLMQFRSRFDLLGIDFGENIDTCRKLYDTGTWVEHDLDDDGPLPIARDDRRRVLICSDVIEHVVHPNRLLLGLRRALDEGACALVISTPERELSRGSHDLGPPQNPAHVREWSLEEFGAFLHWAGLTNGRLGLTRSNNHHGGRHTILGVFSPTTSSGGRLHVDVSQKRVAMIRRRMVATVRALPLLH